MDNIFLAIYHYFKVRRIHFWLCFAVLLSGMLYSASRLTFEEDISKIFPDDPEIEKISEVLEHAKMSERLVVMFSLKDTTEISDPEKLVAAAEQWQQEMESVSGYVQSVSATIEDDYFLTVLDIIHRHLPVFLEEEDYEIIDSLQHAEVVRNTLQQQYQQLISPSGIAVKRIIQNDPLGISYEVLKKLRKLQIDDNFELYNGYIVTKDYRHILCFVMPKYPSSDTGHNMALMDGLDVVMDNVNAQHPEVQASYFGGAAVAVGNAKQLRQDTLVTVGIMLVLLLVLLLGFFKRKRVALFILIPVVVGCLFSLSVIYWYQGSLSILALAVGAVILGIAVNYSLHYLVDLRHAKQTEHVIKTLAKPLTIGSATTIVAFFALRFTNAPMLQDVGLFAGLSLLGAALASLIILPQIVNDDLFSEQKPHVIETLLKPSPRLGKYCVYGILILTPFFYYHAHNVAFNGDMMSLNFMKPELQASQEKLMQITKATTGSVFVVTSGPSLEEALRNGERTYATLHNDLKHTWNKVSSVHQFLLSDSIQQVRIERWNQYWSDTRKQTLLTNVYTEGEKLRFSKQLLAATDSVVQRSYVPYDTSVSQYIRSLFFENYIVDLPAETSLITLVGMNRELKKDLQQVLPASVHVFDHQQITQMFVSYIQKDFNYIVWVTGGIVFLALLIVFGRIEITLLTFIPMMITWIWILGIMALFGIEFNIVNIMVSTFIFGLGDDYSIFTMDGLLEEYRAAKTNLASVRTSVLLSALTTVVGLGVLIFAQHPALRSIALISIIGIFSVYVMAQTLQPYFFRLLITNRTKQGFPPVTALGFISSVAAYTAFILGSFLLTLIGLLLKVVPIPEKNKQYFFHVLISNVTKGLVYSSMFFGKKLIGFDKKFFDTPAVIIANHSSFLDILVMIMMHPKIVLVTNRWVYNSPVFGGVVRMADYLTTEEGVEASTKRTQALIAAGYSIVVFPEGTRSANDHIGRFHKGAFYLAEQFDLPIRPVLLHGAGNCIRKGDFYVNNGALTIKLLPAIAATDEHFGVGYAKRTKSIAKYFKEQHQRLSASVETPSYFFNYLLNNFRYKGPVLEWYMRIKLRLENYYTVFDREIPRNATVLDLGCGYGFLGYMLQFLSKERTITGVDYDGDKIETAQHGYLKSPRLNFIEGDISTHPLEGYNVIVLSDVLHYLPADKQEDIVKRCFRALPSDGMLIVRDGDADLKERHTGTRITEWFSIRLLKFNKAESNVSFLSGKQLCQWGENEGFSVRRVDDTTFTSNVIFVFQKNAVA